MRRMIIIHRRKPGRRFGEDERVTEKIFPENSRKFSVFTAKKVDDLFFSHLLEISENFLETQENFLFSPPKKLMIFFF
jgi:hypothetical protein